MTGRAAFNNHTHTQDMNAEAKVIVCSKSEPVKFTPEQIARFWMKVNRTSGPNGCWEWTKSLTDKGYGQHGIGGKMMRAHRIAYALEIGPIPSGYFVCHKCDNPKCVNPAHLWTGTCRDNMNDMLSKGRGTLFPSGVANASSKLTMPQAIEIRGKYSYGKIGHRRLAREYGVTRVTIQQIIKMETWV